MTSGMEAKVYEVIVYHRRAATRRVHAIMQAAANPIQVQVAMRRKRSADAVLTRKF